MAYTEQTWADGPGGGTPLSAARLNHLEDGLTATDLAAAAAAAAAATANTKATTADTKATTATTTANTASTAAANAQTTATAASTAASSASAAAAAAVAGVPGQVATQINTAGSASRAAVITAGKSREGKWFNAIDYGADPNNGVDSTSALNAMFDAAAAYTSTNGRGVAFIPPGVYKTSGQVYCRSHVEATGADLISSVTSGTALLVGNEDGLTLFDAILNLPGVRSLTTTSGMAAGTNGLVLRNLNTCQVYVPYVRQFSTGIDLQGLGTGSVYNHINLGALYFNQRALELTPLTAGWVNQNLFTGGRFVGTTFAGTEDTSAAYIWMHSSTDTAPNNNTFQNLSLESNITAQYRVLVEGDYNQFMNCRWEAFTGNNRLRWGATAQKNVVFGGAYCETIEEFDIAGSANNKVVLPWLL